MFTGIITHLGTLQKKTPTGITVSAPEDFLKQLKAEKSVAVNGVCLTVVKKGNAEFSVNLMPETWKRTALDHLQTGDLVNLELPVPVNGRFEGHIMQGHVDGTGTITSIAKEGNSRIFSFRIDPSLSRYMIEKGSVAVNGISLTIISVGKDHFTVGIIPYTWNHTMLQGTNVGDPVNIEVDIIAKYVEKMT